MRKLLVFFFCCFLVAGGLSRSAFSQGIWKHYTVADGLPYSSAHTVAVGRDGSVWAGTRNGLARFLDGAWRVYTTADGLVGNDGGPVTIAPDGAVWFATTAGLTRYDGKSWSNYPALALTAPEGGQFGGPRLAVGGNGHVWLVTGGAILKQFDGQNVTVIDELFVKPGSYKKIFATGVTVTSDGAVYLATRPYGVAKYSANQWTFLPAQSAISMALDGNGKLYVGGSSGLEYLSGDQWIWEFEHGSRYPEAYDINAIAVEPNGVFWLAAHYDGVFRVENGIWTHFTPIQNPQYSDLGRDVYSIAVGEDGSVWLATNKGVSRFQYGDVVGVSELDGLPGAFAISGNSPNPFNPSTTISFILPASGAAELSVYSVTGQKVRTLLSRRMEAGVHSAAWDGRDDSGKAVSSGVYIARLRTGKTVASHKMLLMK